MRRGAYASSAALATTALAAATLAGCAGEASPGSGAGSVGYGSRSAIETAPPGRFQDLPEPCGSVHRDTLRALLPLPTPSSDGDGEGAGDDQGDEPDTADPPDPEAAYDGQADVTYDTDRRVGCQWRVDSTEGDRKLSLDFERVVSYDPTVSDDARAHHLYVKKATSAHIPDPSGTATARDTPGTTRSQSRDGSLAAASLADQAAVTSPSGGGTPEGTPSGDAEGDDGRQTAPRSLDGYGDDAFLDDRLVGEGSTPRRDITIVFRSSNVIVTLRYGQWAADRHHLPDSGELQDKAEELADELAGRFDG